MPHTIEPNLINKIRECKRNGKSLHIKNLCDELPSWQDFINLIDLESQRFDPRVTTEMTEWDKELNTVVDGCLFIKQNYYYYIMPEKAFTQAIQTIEQEFSNLFGQYGGINVAYVNLSSKVSEVKPHTDPYDNFYWQCIGSVEWDTGSRIWTVEPGDMVFVPKGSMHSVKFSMPRAAVGFKWEL